jgi:serine/threonine protein kinase
MIDDMIVFGRYRLLKELGEGGMASVYMAQDPILERTVALKLIKSDMTADQLLITRFLNEAKVCASLGHINIVTIFDYGVHETLQYIVMEYIDGPNLAQLMSMYQGKLSEPMIVSILQQIAEGLSVAHSHGIVHRDMKPENIMVNSSGVLKITDFGIAHQQFGPHLTMTGNLIGTPLYMAPEQLDGVKPSPKTDLFALGGVLTYLCTGKPPFPGATAAELFRNIAVAEPLQVRQHNPEISPELESCIASLLQKNPEQRTMDALGLCQFAAAYQKRHQTDPSLTVLKDLISTVGFRSNRTLSDSDTEQLRQKTSQRFGSALSKPGTPPPSMPTPRPSTQRPVQEAVPSGKREVDKKQTVKPSNPAIMIVVVVLCVAALIGAGIYFTATALKGKKNETTGIVEHRDSTVTGTTTGRSLDTVKNNVVTTGSTGKGASVATPTHVTTGSSTTNANLSADAARADSLHNAYVQAKHSQAQGASAVLLQSILNGTPPPSSEIIKGISDIMDEQPRVSVEIADAVIDKSATVEQLKENLGAVRFMRFTAYYRMKDYAMVNRLGLEYKKLYPTGDYFDAVNSMMQAAEQMKKYQQ